MTTTAIVLSAIGVLLVGFCAGFHAAALAHRAICKHLAERGKYASAVWNEKEERWEIRGNFLTIGGKIHRHIRNGEHKKVQYKY